MTDAPGDSVEARDFAFTRSGSEGLSPPIRQTFEIEQRSIMSRTRHPQISVRKSNVDLHDGQNQSVTDDSASEGSVDEEEPKQSAPKASVSYNFQEFIQSSRVLESKLEKFTHTVQKLGSALGLSRASRGVQLELKRVREYFQQHAQTLGVLLTKIKANKSVKIAKRMKRRQRTRENSSQYGGSLAFAYQNDLSLALDGLSAALEKFSIAIGDFEEYSDQEGDMALLEFEIEIKVLSESLSYFGSDGDTPELRRYIAARASSMRKHLEQMAESLDRFIVIGIPCISYAQKRAAHMLLNAATVATFFAGVAATTLQYLAIGPNNGSDTQHLNHIEVAVNALWFSSLVLSIGSAINGMLAMTWRQAVFSSPKRALPWYVRFWLRQGYLALLIASVVAFLAGLVLYVFDTQPRVSFWVVLSFTLFCAIGLANVSAWFGRERWNFAKFREEQRPLRYIGNKLGWWEWATEHASDLLRKIRRRKIFFTEHSAPRYTHSRQQSSPEPTKSLTGTMRSNLKVLLRSFIWTAPTPRPHVSVEMDTGDAPPRPDRPHCSPRHASGHQSQRSQSDLLTRWSSKNILDTNPARAAEYLAQLINLNLKKMSQRESRVKDMQFSPNGRWLVTCYKYSCHVYDVQKSFRLHDVLRHKKSAKQVEWSPDGEWLLTRFKQGVKLWTVDEEHNFRCEKTLNLSEVMDDIQWLDNEVVNKVFLALSNDSNSLFRMSTQSEAITGIPLPRDLTVYEMYSMVDSEHVLFVASRGIEGLPEDKAIDCIIVYTMENESKSEFSRSSVSLNESIEWIPGKIERKIPLLQDVESLSVCGDRQHLLVSYEAKPPEIWKMNDNMSTISMTHELSIPQEYVEEDIAWGYAFFLGPGHNIIACAADGVMHFWHLESRQHFHHLNVAEPGEEIDELPVFSWNPNSRVPMLASATKSYPMKIWVPAQEKDEKLRDDGVQVALIADDPPISQSPTDGLFQSGVELTDLLKLEQNLHTNEENWEDLEKT